MKSKLDKLNELGELLKSGAITQNEFNKLKAELLNPQKQSEENPISENEKRIVDNEQRNFNIKFSIILGLVFVVFVFYKNCDFGENHINKLETKEENNTISEPSKSISTPNIINHLKNNRFSLNGNGNVSFSINSLKNRSQKTTGTIIVSGGRATLQGEISILNDYSFMVFNLQAVDGYFDASTNNGSSGVFYLQSNGNLDGKLSAGGQSKNVTFQVN